MTTFSQVVERTRSRLMTTKRETINRLAANMTSGAETLTLDFDHVGIDRGTRLSVGIEDMHVWDSAGTTPGSQITVERAIDGSTAASHTDGDVVRIDPTWSNWDIAQAVNDELVDLSSPVNGLFAVDTVTFDYNAAVEGYDLPATNMIDVLQVNYDTAGPLTDWPTIPRAGWTLNRNADTTDFASGNQIVLRWGGEPGFTVRVTYAKAFSALAAPDDDVETVGGLHPEAHDILSIGAAIRLLSGLEAQRNYMTGQPDPRRAEEVPSRAAISSLVPLLEQRRERIVAEQARLAAKYPRGY